MQKEVRWSCVFCFFFYFCKIFIPDRSLQQRWSAEEIVHLEMVTVKTRRRLSRTEKQVKVSRRGGKLRRWRCVSNAGQVAGWVMREEESGVIGRLVSRSESEHCVSKLLSAAIKLFSITKCALCTHVSISLCQQLEVNCVVCVRHTVNTHKVWKMRDKSLNVGTKDFPPNKIIQN